MSARTRVPDEFGLLVPQDTGVIWVKQGGGMSCIDRELEGLYIPIGKIKYNHGTPDWTPSGPNLSEKLQSVDLNTDIPEKYRDTIPDHILERGYFINYSEYANWKEDSEYYGWETLYDDLRRFTYGLFDLLDTDPRNRWESPDEIWEAFRESVSFEFEFVGLKEFKNSELSEDYPHHEAAIRPIRLTGSKEGNYTSNIGEEYKGEIVFLLCPNAD